LTLEFHRLHDLVMKVCPPDRPPAPPSACLAAWPAWRTTAVAPGWPLPANGPAGAARGPWRKIVLLSSELRAYAPSREPVISARPASWPPSTSACQASHFTQTTSQPGPAHGRRPRASNSRLRPFVLCVLCASAVIFVIVRL